MNAESACRTMLTEQSKICSHVDMECSCPQVYIQLNENKQMCMKMAKKVLDGGIIGFFCVCVLSFFVLVLGIEPRASPTISLSYIPSPVSMF
jgi:hypothetical protein